MTFDRIPRKLTKTNKARIKALKAISDDIDNKCRNKSRAEIAGIIEFFQYHISSSMPKASAFVKELGDVIIEEAIATANISK